MKRRVVVLLALVGLLFAVLGTAPAAATTVTRPGGTTGSVFVTNKYVWTGDVSQYSDGEAIYHIDVQAGSIVYARWECQFPGGFATDSFNGGVGGYSGDVSDANGFNGAKETFVFSFDDGSNLGQPYCSYHAWATTGGFRITTASIVFTVKPPNPGPGSSATPGPGTSVAGPTPSPTPAPACNVWEGPFMIHPPAGSDFTAYRLRMCAGSFSGADGVFGSWSGNPVTAALPTLPGAAHILSGHWGTGITRGGPGFWQPSVKYNGTGTTPGGFCCNDGAGSGDNPPFNLTMGTQAQDGQTFQASARCGFGACSGTVPAGGYTAGGVTFWWYENAGSGCVVEGPGTPCADVTPTPSPSPSPTPSASPSATPPPPGGGFLPPPVAPPLPTPTTGPNLGGGGGLEEPQPPNPNGNGLALCDAQRGGYSKPGQAPLQPLNDTSFPGSVNPLDYIPWVGNLVSNIPIVIGNTAQQTVNTGVDFVVPGECISTIINDRLDAIQELPPFSVYTSVSEGVAAAAAGAGSGMAIPAIPLPGGGSVDFPLAELADGMSGVRGLLGALVWFAAALTVLRMIAGAFRADTGTDG